MPWVEFESTIPASERAKTVHILDRSATVTGLETLTIIIHKLWTVTIKGDDKIVPVFT
jgi:hypothetical protein